MRSRRRRSWFVQAAAIGVLIGCQAAQASEGLLWFKGGQPSASARQALDLLASAPGHGLDARDYAVPRARQVLSGSAPVPRTDPSTLAMIDGELTAAMERYLTHLHRGRIDPRAIHHDFSRTAVDAYDPARHLRAALASADLAQAVRAAAPQLPQYDRLRAVLGEYRGLIQHAAWQQHLAPLPAAGPGRGRVLKAGATYDDLPRLADRLTALGDLPADSHRPVRYEGALVEAVRRFQHRHGLPVDGHVGTRTLAELEVKPAARVRQIELTLERLRWTPLLRGPRMVLVNVPEFVLRAYEVHDGRVQVREEMKVVVGKALRTRTPLFDEDMRFIEFSPYWNVPPSIARGELVPRLRRDPDHFSQQGFEFVGPDGRVHTRLTGASLDAVLAGTSRIRQRPGPENALGDIKFVFPNSDNIYLHHTPATRLFERERRDFSHGCIRVEKPVALARFVLAAHPDWTEERIRAAMTAGQSSTLKLAQPVPVLIAYGTALVKQGNVHFFDDIYGLDRLLDAALRARSPPLTDHAMSDSSIPGPRRKFLAGTTGFAVAAVGSAWVASAGAVGSGPRRLAFVHTHTLERVELVYAIGGSYDPAALASLNRFLRDHYTGDVGVLDPSLFDMLHAVRLSLGTSAPYEVISGYRCPATNERLRGSRGGGVARHSLHMEGRAIDVRLPATALADLRDAAVSLGRGGVGFYPGERFVHLDTGRVRSW